MVGNHADDDPSALKNLGQGSYELWRACSASKVRVRHPASRAAPPQSTTNKC